ncbi:hypothetical protein K1719_034783 [Acacia pycnantha]|nr:hypothetical protein K1719_034783 [Acacia pycnantha]
MDAAVVGAVLSPTIQTILDCITSSKFREFVKDRELNVQLLDELKVTLIMLDAILIDAEEKQITSPAVKRWLEELKDAVYDAEDLLDEINTDSLRYQVEQDSQEISDKVISLLSYSIGGFYWNLNTKLKEIYQRLKYFAEQKDILHLQSVSRRAHKKTTTSLINESIVVGREDDKEKLLSMLLCDENAEDTDIGVVTIWGMGGVGKTTLAQLLYNDENVQKHFDLKAWACVSKDFNAFEVTKNILESVTSKAYNSQNLDFIQVELRNSLRDKKFLIVMDDLWNEKYSDWDDLVAPFHYGKRGSKIIVTTRQQRVVEITHTFPGYKLSTLTNEDCWHLIAKHALKNAYLDKHPMLEAIGRKIARKCSGLPIAARSIGGLLRSKVDENEWHKILHSNMWDLPSDDVLPALYLSYVYLPPHLKKCFSYCSIFPKDHLLDKKQLVFLWMAEGFVQQHSQLEIESDNCFNELLSRSLIQQHEVDPEKFIMHDLIIDLAKFVSGNSCLWLGGNEMPKPTTRHLSYPKQEYDGSEMFKSFYHINSLRTFLPQQIWAFIESSVLCKKVSHDLLPKLTYLRVLSLSMYSNITELPDSIRNLRHLRYLDLSHTKITRLPDATFTLYNLQTLLLSYCKSFGELPKSIEKLINLRHLDITGTALKVMPTQIATLQNLHSLSTFVVGKQSDELRIKELRKLPHLEGKLSILKLQNVVDSKEAFEANLNARGKIEELVLEWDSEPQDSPIVKNVLNMLRPSTKLQRLTLNHYGGTSFPNWVGDPSYTNITFLCMSSCKDCSSLAPFGQLPSLKKLSIQGMASIRIVGHEFYCNQTGPSSFHLFPSLEVLRFEDMIAWEQWIPFEGEGNKFPFPSLKHLYLYNCPKLRGDMPNNLPLLRKVNILNCNQLEAKSSTLKWITCTQKLNINQGKEDFLRAIENHSLDSLKRLRITDCSSLQPLPRMISACHCLQKLYLKSIPSLESSFPIHGLPTSLQRLKIEECIKLEFLPQESWQNYTSLEFLLIKNSCDSLTFFPIGGFPKLKILVVEGCCNLETLTQVGVSSPTLESLVLSDCKQLRSMSQVQIESLTTLKYFSLSQLPNLESLPQCGLPSNLRSFFIVDCERLSSIPIKEWGFEHLASLLGLQVKGDGSEKILCNLLKFQLLPTSLVRIDICDFSNLKLLDFAILLV